jgi:hypothetical protein
MEEKAFLLWCREEKNKGNQLVVERIWSSTQSPNEKHY